VGIPLRIAEPTGGCRRYLRRWRSGDLDPCPAGGYCNANVLLIEIPWAERREASADDWPHDDPAWPGTCDRCPYEFTDADCWQRHDDRVYRLPDGAEITWWGDPGKAAPAGAMIRADWYDAYADRGESWLVVLPDGGTWITTQQASGGGYWAVAGTPPRITASPSIFHNAPHGWHGWIRDGELVDA
jgi:hypothetical protein